MKTIFTNGCFDIVHRGHLELLKYCKSQGYVIVGLNSDSSVKKLKGPSRPFFNEQDRKFMLQSIKYVDEVIVFEEDTPLETIVKLKPDIVVKGGDYKIEDIVGYGICDIKVYNYIDGYSTTNILKGVRDEDFFTD